MIWIFSSKGCYKRINKIRERSLSLILNDYKSSFDSLLSTLNEKTIHQRYINVLLTEVYKYLNGYSPDLMNEVFYLRQKHYNLRNFNVFATDNPRSLLLQKCKIRTLKMKLINYVTFTCFNVFDVIRTFTNKK